MVTFLRQLDWALTFWSNVIVGVSVRCFQAGFTLGSAAWGQSWPSVAGAPSRELGAGDPTEQKATRVPVGHGTAVFPSVDGKHATALWAFRCPTEDLGTSQPP